MVRTEQGAGGASRYNVAQIRGPYLHLPPHRDHCDDVDSLKDYCRARRRRGEVLAADLFSGAGGISLGLEDAGFEVVLGVDHYLDAVKTHRHHFPGMSVDWDLSSEEAIEKVAGLMRECGIQVLAGGPPCQPFSKAGRNGIRDLVERGLREPHDVRRDLWRSYLEIVSLARPAAIIMENVPDMALDQEMFILRSVIEELEQLGYSVYERVVETWRYGVPQHRQRLIIVAFRDGIHFEWPEDHPEKVTLWNAIGDMPEVEGGWRPEGGADGWIPYDGPQTAFQRYIRRRVAPEDRGKLFDHITRPVRDDDREAFNLMDANTKYSDLPESLRRYRSDIYDDKYKRLDENDVSRTITAHIAKDGYGYIHPRQPRTLTVREAARIQTFPDDFRFNGPPSAAFKQIGNAVPPRAAAAIAQAMAEWMKEATPGRQWSRETASALARWFRGRPAPERILPWLWTGNRWRAAVGEIVLTRMAKRQVDQIWPVIEAMPAPEADDPHVPGDTVDVLVDMLDGAGMTKRADRLRRFVDQLRTDPGALWRPAVDRKVLKELTPSEAALVELIAPVTGTEGGVSEEPVLVTRGVGRVTSRYQSISMEKKNRLTDGRLAVARMLGLNEGSRSAHLGLIELAQSHCRIANPVCATCPLLGTCDRFGVSDAQGTMDDAISEA
ncbi:DNA cytosine methyltransferase [Corynebacterium bovis]|uniref:DNA cytosine methyltransferase n=1 Tax=Corynebacterium bovis TaxID=36808 RepID=UPI0021AB14B4|nr:DNA cytosine methyltransferase [Corynebacterium bovis]